VNSEPAEHLARCINIACFTNASPVQQVKRWVFSRVDGISFKLENRFESKKNLLLYPTEKRMGSCWSSIWETVSNDSKVVIIYFEEIQHLAKRLRI